MGIPVLYKPSTKGAMVLHPTASHMRNEVLLAFTCSVKYKGHRTEKNSVKDIISYKVSVARVRI